MGGMWAKPVGRAEPFDADLDELTAEYPDLPATVDAFASALVNNPRAPRIPLDGADGSDDSPGVFVHLLDYPPLGREGRRRFRVTYHAPPRDPNPWQQFTLLSIREHVRGDQDGRSG